MIYRSLGKTGVELSQLGFGCMRFPVRDKYDPTTIDENASTEMIDYAIEQGINYFDNAWPYHREKSEEFTGQALKKHRDKIYLASKMPVWLVKEKSDGQKYFDIQRRRLQSDMIDMYLLHSIARRSWQTVKDNDLLRFLDKVKQKGDIRYAGFSYHDELGLFKEVVEAYPWDFCQIQLNYVDTEYQAGIKGLEYAAKKGLGVIIMEPLRGGKLSGRIPEEINNLIRQTAGHLSPTEFALRFLFNRPEISCVLSGMSSIEQVNRNIKFANTDYVNSLHQKDLLVYEKARKVYQSRIKVDCTACEYCTPCPQKIPIPFLLELYNDIFIYNAIDESKRVYRVFVKPESRAKNCTSCMECEEKCPQNIAIAEAMADIERFLGSK